MRRIFLLLVFTFIISAVSADHDNAAEVIDGRWMKSHYTKAEYMIPMRDGVKLYTAVYAPKDKKRLHPILMQRTPNGCQPYGKKNVTLWERVEYHKYLRNGYVLIFQDVRGKGMSEGEFVFMRPYIENKQGSAHTDESSDTYDTIEWLMRKIKRNNGYVGLYGCMEEGFYAIMGAACAHPAIKAVSPQAPIVGWNDGYVRRNGALALKDSISEDVIAHAAYDEWWQARDIKKAAKRLSAPIMLAGSSYDTANPYGTWLAYQAVRSENPTLDCRLVIGPWSWDAWHDAGSSDSQTSDEDFSPQQFRDEMEFPFFERHLRGVEDGDMPTKSLIYFTGEECWREMDYWDLAKSDTMKLFFHEDGALRQDQSAEINSYSSYLSDPVNPVPYTVGSTDAANSEPRSDVATFISSVLEDDITLVGDIATELYAALSQSDADFIVKVIDVGPNCEYERLVCSDIMRGRYRKSATAPEPFSAGQIEKIALTTPATPHTFMAGHRIKIEVQSSWFPLYERNPQQYIDIDKAAADDYKPCEVKIYHDKAHASSITFSIMR